MNIRQILLRELNRRYYAPSERNHDLLVGMKLRELRFLKDGASRDLIPEIEQAYQAITNIVNLHPIKLRLVVELINEMFDLQMRDEKLLVVTAAEFDATLDRHDEQERE